MLASRDPIVSAMLRERNGRKEELDVVEKPRAVADRQVQPCPVVEDDVAAVGVTYAEDVVHPANV